MFCPKVCRNNEQIVDGVFLLHLGCEAKNPFWDKTRKVIAVPGTDPDGITTEGEIDLGAGSERKEVRHWEIGMLRQVPNNLSDEMWFPLMLLRATAEQDPSQRRVGALVELSGTQRVGKTVVALQAMDDQGYVPTGSRDRSVRVNGFIFSRTQDERASNTPLLSMLYLHSCLMSDGVGAVAPQGTPPRTRGDVKAAFILPADNPLAARSDGNQMASGLLQRARSFLGKAAIFGAGAVSRANAARTKRHYWHTIIFYDAAGEDEDKDRPRPEMVAVDKLAIFLDARVLLEDDNKLIAEENELQDAIDENVKKIQLLAQSGGSAEEQRRLDVERAQKQGRLDEVKLILTSIETAVRRIAANNDGRQIPCCIVITKLDLVNDKLSDDVKQKVKRVVNDLSGDSSVLARELLTSWLQGDGVRGNKQRLLRLLDEDERLATNGSRARAPGRRKRTKNIDRVFFVWTENLTNMRRRDRIQPESHGLIQFVCWCLGNRWSDINLLGDRTK
jgi:hypothetical protein